MMRVILSIVSIGRKFRMKDIIIELLSNIVVSEYVLTRVSFTLFAFIFSLYIAKILTFLRMFSHNYASVKASYFINKNLKSY